jgi:hypothetical protein
MRIKSSSEFVQLEAWLNILITTYKDHPSGGLAKTINYYLSRLLHHDDIDFDGNRYCDYSSMQKYWRWQINN